MRPDAIRIVPATGTAAGCFIDQFFESNLFLPGKGLGLLSLAQEIHAARRTLACLQAGAADLLRAHELLPFWDSKSGRLLCGSENFSVGTDPTAMDVRYFVLLLLASE